MDDFLTQKCQKINHFVKPTQLYTLKKINSVSSQFKIYRNWF
jgi:hypothetical protein